MSNPNSVPERCTEILNHSSIVVKAKGRVAIFLNPSKTAIKKIDVDCWIASSKLPKSDFVLSKTGIVDVIVELKGKEIDHAIQQILSTLAQWKVTAEAAPKVGGLIVFTRSPFRSAALNRKRLSVLLKHKLWLEMCKSASKEHIFETFTQTQP